MTAPILPTITSPKDLQTLSLEQLQQLTDEMREELVRVLSIRPAHFASNLGVVELCLALHLTYDFSYDRLIWDTGHQIYPQKLITGRYENFDTIRTRGGLMGYPNPHESEYDLFMTGHAGCSVACSLGLKAGDDLRDEGKRKSVAVIGDGALPSGIVFEALNNAGELKKDLLVVLNDNGMSICPRVGAIARTLDQTRMNSLYQGSKKQFYNLMNKIPLVGGVASQMLDQVRDGLKAFFGGAMLFEELGFRYFGPIDGHDLPTLLKWLKDVKEQEGPILLHVYTKKGYGVPEATDDPVKFHTPPVFEEVGPNRSIVALKSGSSKAYTNVISSAIYNAIEEDKNVAVITAAMCQGNKLQRVRDDFPENFFDVGICEAHGVSFAAGMAKAGARPICAIYSTFLQRAFDHIFQEVALQNLPVTFCLDRSGLTAPDGPTHHGVFDIAYLRIFPNFVVMAPGDELDVAPMLQFALKQPSPTSMRYPKTSVEKVDRTPTPIELGRSEVLDWGDDVIIVGYGTLFPFCARAAERLRGEGYNVGLINARFVKPLDQETLFKALEQASLVVTVEEGVLAGGFGSAVLEAANAAGVATSNLVRLGIPDEFVEHAERGELLASLGLDEDGICNAVRERVEVSSTSSQTA